MIRTVKAAGLLLGAMTAGSGHGGRPSLAPDGVLYDWYASRRSDEAVILVHGLTINGERDRRLVNFARAVASVGPSAAAVRLPGLASLRFDPADLGAVRSLATHLHQTGHPIKAVAGFSIGGGVALAAYASLPPPGPPPTLLLFGPHHDLGRVWTNMMQRLAQPPSTPRAWDDFIYARAILAFRSLEKRAEDLAQRERLIGFLEAYCHIRHLSAKLDFNRDVLASMDADPAYSRPGRACLAALSPEGRLGRLPNRVMLLHDPDDRMVPPSHSRAIMAELMTRRPNGGQRLLITPWLSHVNPRAALRPADLIALLSMIGRLVD